MSLSRAFATVGGLTMLSRIAGFIRDILTATILGAGPVADAFFVALKFPNFFRRITAEGAFSYAFIPVYSSTLEKENQDKASEFATQSLSMMVLCLTPFLMLAFAFMPFLMRALAPGFEVGEPRYDWAVDMTRITLPYLLCMSLTALLGGVLNSHNRFAPFAATPIFFNLSLIAALLFLPAALENAGFALSWGVFAAGVIQLIWIYICYRRAGLKIGFSFSFYSAKIKKLLSLMGPAALGAGVTQINLFIDVILASLLPVGAVSYLYYADRLNQLPMGVVGVAIGTALLPLLSRSVAAKNAGESSRLFFRSIEFGLLLSLPAAVALFVMPQELIHVLFERGSFDMDARVQTAYTLMAYSVGLPAYVLVKIFNTAFFSKEDTKTPVKISIFVTAVNIALSLALIMPLAQIGIALATGIAGWVHCGLLMIMSKRARVLLHEKSDVMIVFKRLAKIMVASLVMGGCLYMAKTYLMASLFQGHFVEEILSLSALVIGGGVVYFGIVLATKAITIKNLKTALKK